MPFQSRLFAGLSSALVVFACGEIPTPPPPPGSYALTLLSSTLSIVPGGETTVNITLGRTNFIRNVTLAVDFGDGHGTMPSLHPSCLRHRRTNAGRLWIRPWRQPEG